MTDDSKIDMLPIDFIPLKDIIPSSNNTKIHTADQVAAIKRSIMEFGFNDPIAIDEKMEIVEGHGRFKAVTELGGTHIPCIRLNNLTEAQVRAYRIAHNKITMQTGFDMDMLKTELTDLDLDGFDINITGFTMEDVNFTDFDFSPEDNYEEEDDSKEVKKKASSSVVQYILIFDDELQQKEWYKLLKYLRHEGEGDTISEKLITFLKENNPEIFE